MIFSEANMSTKNYRIGLIFAKDVTVGTQVDRTYESEEPHYEPVVKILKTHSYIYLGFADKVLTRYPAKGRCIVRVQ